MSDYIFRCSGCGKQSYGMLLCGICKRKGYSMKLFVVIDRPDDRFSCGVIESGHNFEYVPYKNIRLKDLVEPDNFISLDQFLMNHFSVNEAIRLGDEIWDDLELDTTCRVWVEKEKSYLELWEK